MLLLITGALIFVFGFGLCFFVLDQTLGQGAFSRKRLEERSQAILGNGPQKSLGIEKNERLSDIKAINQLLKRRKSSEKLKRMLEKTGWRISLGVFLSLSLLLAMVVYLILFAQKFSPLVCASISISLLILVPALILRIAHQRYMDKFSFHFPKALQLIRSALHAGLGLPTALERAAKDAPYPVNIEMDYLLKEMAMGKTLAEALIGLQKRVPTTDMKTFVIGVTVQQESGGNLAELMRNLEDTIQSKVMMRKELRVLTSQARMSGWILGLLPIFLMIVIRALNPGYLAYLFEDEVGQKLLLQTLILQVFGFIVIKKMVSFKISA